MTDSLRDRIAAVIRREVPCHPPAADRIADVLIRELGLVVEDGECGYCHAMLPGCRYVTEWISEVTDDG